MQARPHQVKARESVIESFDDGCHKQVVNMACGTGKNFVMADLYEHLKSRLPGKLIIVTHTEELVDQTIETMKLVNPELRVDKEMAQHKADPTKADIIVASVKSLGRKGTSRLSKYNWEDWDKVFIDEAHHTPANSYLNILGACGILQSATPKLLLGVTATSQRPDGRALSGIYDKISYVYSLRQAIEDGQLVDIRGYRIDTKTNIANVGTSDGDFKPVELAETINTPERNANIVAGWEKVCENRQTAVFCGSIAHAEALADEFKLAGIKAEYVYGDDPLRTEKLAAFEAAETTVMCNVNVLGEGVDIPIVACVVWATPTKSPVRFNQGCGRGTRLFEGKKDLIVLDVCDMSGDHTLCTVPTLMGLPDKLDLCGQSLFKSVKEIEKAQEENPNIDFMKLQKVTDLKSFVENINLFEIRFPPEVEAASDFKWCKSATGGYRMSIPKGRNGEAAGFVHIQQNMLDGWEIKGQIRGIDVIGQRPTMEEAFAAADNAIRTRAEGSVALVDRKSSWNTKDATSAQLGLLKKLYGGKPWPATLTRGQAAHYIDQKISKRAK
jgi:ATP-dependent helicase IRC3